MIRKAIITFLLCRVAFCYPQAIKIPEIINGALPEEVNALAQHKQYPRSIGSSAASYNNVEETIEEVENMIKANPTLPRLTRGEILDLIENITKADLATGTKSSNEKGKLKERDPKAIMVVMPYTPNVNDNTMEELFTKPPVTHIIGAEPFKKPEEAPTFQKESKKQANIVEIGTKKPIFEKGNVPLKQITSAPIFLPTPVESNDHFKYLEKKTPQRKRKLPQSTTEPQIASTETPSTTHPPRQRRPIRRRPTTTEKHPNHRYPDEEFMESANDATPVPIGGIRIIDAPKFSPDKIIQDLFVQEDQQKNVYVKKEEMLTKAPEKQVSANILVEQTTTSSPLVHLNPQYFAGVPFDIKPEVTTKDLPPTTRFPTTTSSLKEEEDKIKNMLASFGLLQTSSSTTTSVPDISNVADNLTPEMRDLLISFGLIPNPQEKPATAAPVEESYNPVKAEVKPESYMHFKPLPEDYSSRREMDELLAQFGLGSSSRKRKSLPKKKEEQGLKFDAVPDQFKGVLDDIGLTDREGRMIKAESLVKTQEKQHVFNPVDTQYASKEELEKLNKLLDVVKQLEKLNGTVTDEDLKKIDADNLKELISGLNEDNKIVPLDEQNAPNPINYDHSLKKNEVKRQENSTSTTTSTTTTSTTTATTETVTPNIKDLEDSFGGQVETSPVTEPPVPETTTRRTGFYFLVDWNTFLDIDDQKGKRVNLRFQPTIGDPKQFYSVAVP